MAFELEFSFLKIKPVFFYVISLIFFFSCEGQDILTNPEIVEIEMDKNLDVDVDIPIPQLDLVYEVPPIEIDDIDFKFSRNIYYSTNENNDFDIFLPTSNTPTGLVIYYHGGGFRSGSKESIYNSKELIQELLKNNIALVTVNYRLLKDSDQEGVLKSLNDSKRCLQFIKYYATSFNIDKNKIVLYGSSAGAGTASWIAFNDDMAQLNSDDPILSESTRVKGAVLKETQCTYDIDLWEKMVFRDYNINIYEAFLNDPVTENIFLSFYGINKISDFYSEKTVKYRKEVDMLSLLSLDDPEFWLSNSNQQVAFPVEFTDLYHHAYQARTLKEKADIIGVTNISYYGKSPQIYSDPSKETQLEFMIRKIKE